MTTRPWFVAIVVVGVIWVAACSGGSPDVPTDGGSHTTDASTSSSGSGSGSGGSSSSGSSSGEGGAAADATTNDATGSGSSGGDGGAGPDATTDASGSSSGGSDTGTDAGAGGDASDSGGLDGSAPDAISNDAAADGSSGDASDVDADASPDSGLGSPTLVSITVDSPAPSEPVGVTIQLGATGKYTDGSTKDLTATVAWSTSPTGIASVSNASGTQGRATGLAVGMTTVVALDPATQIAGLTPLSVTAAALVSIGVTPSSPTVAVAASLPLDALGTYTDGSTRDLTTSVIWSSSSPAVATVSNVAGSQGVVTTLDVGGTTVTATDPATGSFGNTVVTVVPRTVTGALVDLYVQDDGSQIVRPQPLVAGTTAYAIPWNTTTTLPGTIDPTTGQLSVAAVPAGKYWLVIDQSAGGGPVTMTEHQVTTPDLSFLEQGRPDAALATASTPVTMNVTGMTPWQAGVDLFEVESSGAAAWVPAYAAPFGDPDLPAGATSVSGTFDWFAANASSPLPAASGGDVTFVHHLSSTTITSGPAAGRSYLSAVDSARLTGVTIANGTGGAIAAALTPVPQTGSLSADVRAADFEALGAIQNPAATQNGTQVYVDDAANLGAEIPHSRGGYPDLLDIALSPGAANTDFGTLAYGQFLDPIWRDYLFASYTWSLPVQATGASRPRQQPLAVTSYYPSAAFPVHIGPVLGPVGSLQIGGTNAYQKQTGVGTSPALTFTAPALGTATSYLVRWCSVTASGKFTVITPLLAQLFFPDPGQATFSVSLPPGMQLRAGGQYYAIVLAVSSTATIDQYERVSVAELNTRQDDWTDQTLPRHVAIAATSLFSP